MRKNTLKTLILLAVVLTILVYFAQMLNVTRSQTKKHVLVHHESEATVGRIESAPQFNRPQSAESSKQEWTENEEDTNFEREMDIFLDDSLSFESRMDLLAKIRRHRITNTCIRNKLSNGATDLNQFTPGGQILVSDKHKAIFCSTGDVNSEKWKQMLQDDGEDEATTIRLLSSYRKESISYRLKYYFKFMMVQEPLVRLLAAYKSWLLPHPNDEEDENMRKIVEEIQKLSLKIRLNFDPENFYNREPNATNYARLSDFVSYIINQTKSGQELFPFWERYYILCQPCEIPYDYVLRPETTMDDARYVLAHLKDASQKQFYPGHMDSSDAESLGELREGITPGTAETLYELYRNDYEMFGYPKSWN